MRVAVRWGVATSWLLWGGLALAQPAAPPAAGPELTGLEVLPIGERRSFDVEVHVGHDGALLIGEKPVIEGDLVAALSPLAAKPGARLVVSADADAPHGKILTVIDLGHQAGFARIAMEVGAAARGAPDPLFPGDAGEVTELDSGLSRKQLRKLRPKRWKFPQNPYGAIDWTAYALEQGEVRLGFGGVHYGIALRTQIGTMPLADFVGAYNLNVKSNLMREGPIDGALLGNVWVVPVTGLIDALDEAFDLGFNGEVEVDPGITNTPSGATNANTVTGSVAPTQTGTGGSGASAETFTFTVVQVGLGMMGSAQVKEPWSLHLGWTYNRIGARGAMSLEDLPTVVVRGVEITGGEGTIVPRIVAELIQIRFASDFRFNRRDSVVFQLTMPVYAQVRGVVPSEDLVDTSDDLAGYDLAAIYGDFIPPSDGYRTSLAWQFSWKQIDLRLGVAWWALFRDYMKDQGTVDGPHAALGYPLPAFDLAYRFGGETRREERGIRQGYRDNRKELKGGADTE